MMQKRHYRRERGQATMEIAVAAVAIIFLVLGFFVLGGIGITSIKSLLLTRFYAEKNAAEKNIDSPSGIDQLSGWEYTKIVQKRADENLTIVIPFLAQDEPVKIASDLGGGYLTEENPSLSLHPDLATEPDSADYVWQSFDNLVTRQITLFNSTVLAALHRQAPVLPDNIGSEQNYLFRTIKGKQKLRHSSWGDFQNIDITQWESSVVAFPAFAPQK